MTIILTMNNQHVITIHLNPTRDIEGLQQIMSTFEMEGYVTDNFSNFVMQKVYLPENKEFFYSYSCTVPMSIYIILILLKV